MAQCESAANCRLGQACNYVLPCTRLSSRPVVRTLGCMDELTAVAAVVDTTNESNADDGAEQRGHCGADSVAVAPMEGVESTTDGKENDVAATLPPENPGLGWIPPDLPYISGPGGESSIDWA